MELSTYPDWMNHTIAAQAEAAAHLILVVLEGPNGDLLRQGDVAVAGVGVVDSVFEDAIDIWHLGVRQGR